MRLVAILSSLLIAASTTVSAFSIPLIRDVTHHTISSDFLITRRQSSIPASTKSNTTNSTATTGSPYEAAIVSSCTSTLSLLAGEPESASGMSLCYNIISLNNSTGVFKSDLRLFKVAEPRDGWKNVSMKTIVPSVNWRGSGASLMGSQRGLNAPKNTTEETSIVRRDTQLARRAEKGGPALMESYSFIGQINPEFLNRTMNSSNLQALLLPVVTLAVNGHNITASLSTAEASFLVNVFSATPLTAHPFVLPGVTMKIFPIGLIITGSWTIIFTGVIGWGAVKKMQFREHYRRRIARDEAVGRGRMRI